MRNGRNTSHPQSARNRDRADPPHCTARSSYRAWRYPSVITRKRLTAFDVVVQRPARTVKPAGHVGMRLVHCRFPNGSLARGNADRTGAQPGILPIAMVLSRVGELIKSEHRLDGYLDSD